MKANYTKGSFEAALLMSGEWEVTLHGLESSGGAGDDRRPIADITAVGPDLEAAMEIAAGEFRGAMEEAWPLAD